MIVVAAGGPNWVDAVTALGTVGAVVAAVGIALWIQHQSHAQLVGERRLALEREQLNEAYRVQVVLGQASVMTTPSAPY